MTRRSPAATVSLARRALLTSALLTSALLTSALLTSALLTSALLTSACSSDSGSSAAALDAAGGAGSGDRAADVGTPGGPGAGRSGGASAEADAGGAQGLGGDATPASSDAAAGPSREPGLPSTAVRPQRPSSWVSHPDRVPTAIHMTFQEDPATSVTFTWATGATDLEAYTPRVWLVPAAEVAGDDDIMPLGAGWVSEGTGHAYQTVLLDTVVDETVYVRWTVVVEGLQPATDYVWRVGSWGGFDAATGALVDPDLSARGSVRTAT